MEEGTVTITRGMTVDDPKDLVGTMYPVFAGIKHYARDNGIDVNKGRWTLHITWEGNEDA